MNTTDWMAAVRQEIRQGKEVYLLPPDCHGDDGYDIAEMPRPDLSQELREYLRSEGLPCLVVAMRLRGGPIIGYQVTPIDTAEQYRLCQHSGAWGPWYHVSRYVPGDKKGWRFAGRIGGHYNYRQALELGLPFGRPE